MTKWTRCLISLCLLMVLLTGTAFAQDPAIVDIFQNGVYGGLAGALVGAAALAFTEEPEDHLNYIAIGAGVGVIVGTAYGVYTATRPLAMIEDSRIRWSLPTPQAVALRSGPDDQGPRIEYRLHLLAVRF